MALVARRHQILDQALAPTDLEEIIAPAFLKGLLTLYRAGQMCPSPVTLIKNVMGIHEDMNAVKRETRATLVLGTLGRLAMHESPEILATLAKLPAITENLATPETLAS